jgi:hypothetical protein
MGLITSFSSIFFFINFQQLKKGEVKKLELGLWGIWVIMGKWCVVFMSDWKERWRNWNLGYEEFGFSWVSGVLFSCQIEGELKKLRTCIMRNWVLGFGFRACCCFHVRLKESWNNWELWLWVWGVLLFSCQIEGELKQFELGAMVESNWFWGMKKSVRLYNIKFVFVCSLVIISLQYVFQCGHVVLCPNFDFLDNKL